jgi:demethylmenaquinone methyltransferase / 2-methoxy-6-polyprenyl-1,4-benzoquinol methylase
LSDPSKNPERIASMFDAIAGRYDFLNHFLSGGIDRRWRRRAIRSLSLTGAERVLDVCTGTGDLAIAARTADPPAARVIGLDFAGAMLRVGLGKLRARQLAGGVTLVRGDATRMPVADRSMNAVTIAFGIRNVDDVGAVCAEMHRVLKPGGRMAILEFAIPTTPGVRGAYLWYFEHVLPLLGRAVSGHATAYRYLQASVSAFATPDELVKLLRQTGFAEVTASPLTFGTVYLYTGRRD